MSSICTKSERERANNSKQQAGIAQVQTLRIYVHRVRCGPCLFSFGGGGVLSRGLNPQQEEKKGNDKPSRLKSILARSSHATQSLRSKHANGFESWCVPISFGLPRPRGGPRKSARTCNGLATVTRASSLELDSEETLRGLSNSCQARAVRLRSRSSCQGIVMQ